jgi:glycogen debranching enzyme
VEIQALWYNALCTMKEFAERFRDYARSVAFEHMAAKARESFNQRFWNSAEQCLYDVVGEVPDASIRPNQIFAVSLPFSLLDEKRSKAVVEKVESDLLTPYGLRTLSRRDPKYIGKYEGDPRMRDSAYHQGTVWPWLLGPFLSAYQKVYGKSEKTWKKVRNCLQTLEQHLSEAGLGSVSEIFCGDEPHSPCGCIAQAWSVGELLRTRVELGNSRETEDSRVAVITNL